MSDTEQELKPGRSTDRLCAAKLGYEWLELDGAFGSVGRWVEPGSQNSAYDLKMRYTEGIDQPRYSTSMDDAWQLVEEAKNKGHKFVLEIWSDRKYHIAFFALDGGLLQDNCSETAPLAIVRAFLALPDLGEIR
jgi:hypothetical protein